MIKNLALFVLIDIDECGTGMHSCHGNAQCTNSAGSYTCRCQSYYAGNGRSCFYAAGKADFTGQCQEGVYVLISIASFACLRFIQRFFFKSLHSKGSFLLVVLVFYILLTIRKKRNNYTINSKMMLIIKMRIIMMIIKTILILLLLLLLIKMKIIIVILLSIPRFTQTHKHTHTHIGLVCPHLLWSMKRACTSMFYSIMLQPSIF